ncbi:hypothetical protein GCM10010320_72060 [Streptomyces caelestis]|nr:hypothetical protein GCM10010320_72060 [Streptomyces caelestis]
MGGNTVWYYTKGDTANAPLPGEGWGAMTASSLLTPAGTQHPTWGFCGARGTDGPGRFHECGVGHLPASPAPGSASHSEFNSETGVIGVTQNITNDEAKQGDGFLCRPRDGRDNARLRRVGGRDRQGPARRRQRLPAGEGEGVR